MIPGFFLAYISGVRARRRVACGSSGRFASGRLACCRQSYRPLTWAGVDTSIRFRSCIGQQNIRLLITPAPRSSGHHQKHGGYR